MQQELAEQRQAAPHGPMPCSRLLKRPMLATMPGEPVPPTLWRCPVVKRHSPT